jgi:hypothetical protein
MSAYDVIEALETGEPPVFVGQGLSPRGGLQINPLTLEDGEERVIADRISEVLREGR